MFEHVIAKYDTARVASRPLVGPSMTWDAVLMWRSGYRSRAAQAWLDCVQQVYPFPLPSGSPVPCIKNGGSGLMHQA